MNNQILDYFAKVHGNYLHSNGKIATQSLIKLLNCTANEQILEIGFGTGATLVYLASINRKTQFHGLELSEKMFQTASKRLRFCGLSKTIQLHLVNSIEHPFMEDNSFDKIYIESVLAIQDGDGVKKLLEEIRRLLKPNGVLIFNETIWLDSVHIDVAKKINSECLKSFGIIQSNSALTHLSDWMLFMEEHGFRVEEVIKTDDIKKSTALKFQLPILRSGLYHLLGKMKFIVSPSLRSEWKNYTQEMSKIIPSNQKMMTGILLKALNKK